VQNIECKAAVTSSFHWTTEPDEYSNLFFDLDLLGLILQGTTLNGNKKKMRNMPPYQKELESQTGHLQPYLALLSAMINMGLHPMSDIANYFSQQWVNKFLSFLMCCQGMIFCSCSGTFILHMLRDKVN
jgi:hypothetical protein